MTKVFKAAGVWLAISVVVWLFTIWRWQTTGHVASTQDIVSQLLLLPVLLAAVWLGAMWALAKLRAQAAQPAASALGEAPAPLAPGSAGAAAAPPVPHAWVLAEALVLPAGPDAASAWTALTARTTRPGLDPVLQDLDGMPVFTGRVSELDMDDWMDAHAELSSDAHAGLTDLARRSLALLEAPLNDMLTAVAALVPEGRLGTERGAAVPADGSPSMKAHLSGVATPISPAAAAAERARAPQLTVRLVLPATWSAAERQGAIDWARSQCGALLDWVDATGARGVRWLTDPLPHPEALWDELDQTLVQWSRQAHPELLMLLVVDSQVHEAHIEHMQSVGALFTGAHQSGCVPGEGAAACLLASPHWPDLDALPEPPIQLWQPARTRRDKSADAAGRIGCSALSAALNQVCTWTQGTAATLHVVSDADHRGSRTAELFEALQEVVPGLDPMTQVARVGEACGDLGLARALTPAALACHALRQGELGEHAVALLAHVQSSHERVVVGLTPRPPAPLAA